MPIFLSLRPSVQAFSWNCITSFFFNFGMVIETHMKLFVTEPYFLEKNLLPQNLGKLTKNGSKTEFFEFIERFDHLIMNLFYNENIYFACFFQIQES